MDGSFRIGRIFGIPILIHYSFILVIPLFAWIIGSQITVTTDMLQGYFSIPIDTSLITEGIMPGFLAPLSLSAFLRESSFTNSPIRWSPAAKGSKSTTSRS